MNDSAAISYLLSAAALIERLAKEQHAQIGAAAEIVSNTLLADGLVHVFGSGHSHMLALEGFYRAGGLAAVNPVLLESLMLHGNAVLSTSLERTEGIGTKLLTDLAPDKADCLIVVSNSGTNRVAVELAQAARAQGLSVIAIVSALHARARTAEQQHKGGPSLLDLADVVIDNLGEPGDASVEVRGVAARMGPTSSVTGAAIMHAIAIAAAERAVKAGETPAVFASSNVEGGDERNAATIARYRNRVRSL